MWARMPIQGLMADIPVDEWPERMENHLCQPWDCMSHHHSVISIDRASSSPWYAKIDGEFYLAKYIFTVDYTEHEIADSPDQHKQSHVLYLTEGKWKGNLVALPNNRVRVTNPALWVTGEGPPDFIPSQWIHSSEEHESYTDPNITFDNLYSKGEKK
ncbi:MAG: hypothetical protein CMM02_02985 [Rhodopirellula sp.]|nr:hypothetical protein [Rhodopirellula sp.]